MVRNCISGLFFSLLLAVNLVACNAPQNSDAPAVTAPAISLEIGKDGCPSIETQAGMQVTWTNRDTEDHVLLLARTDESGVLIDTGGTDLLQPGSTFSIILTEPGQYTYYCSEDWSAFGTITVLPLRKVTIIL